MSIVLTKYLEERGMDYVGELRKTKNIQRSQEACVDSIKTPLLVEQESIAMPPTRCIKDGVIDSPETPQFSQANISRCPTLKS